ncbi:MAG: hypothetical protein JRJ49_00460 [Deltaproteobacteria bacterium]|nr:hypothetical protein [Deltaproteobacteria bacterium]
MSNTYKIIYPKIGVPNNLVKESLEQIKNWFCNTAAGLQAEIDQLCSPEQLFDDITKYFKWNNLKDNNLFEFANQNFRGKEAFNKLCNTLMEKLEIKNFNIEAFKKDILKNLRDNQSSEIFKDLEKLLQPVFIQYKQIISD